MSRYTVRMLAVLAALFCCTAAAIALDALGLVPLWLWGDSPAEWLGLSIIGVVVSVTVGLVERMRLGSSSWQRLRG